MRLHSLIGAILACFCSLANAADYCWANNIPPNFNLYTVSDAAIVYSSSSAINTTSCGITLQKPSSFGGAFALYIPKSDANYQLFVNEIMMAKSNGSTLNFMIRTSQYNSTYGYLATAINFQ